MKRKKQIIILISGTGSNMATLIKQSKLGALNAEVAAVFSDNPLAAGLTKAIDENIPTRVFPYNVIGKTAAEQKMRDCVKKIAPDFIVLAGFMRVLSAKFVNCFENRIINIHPSLLPKFKGAHAIRDALNAGVNITGVTVHWVNENIDAGKIISQQPVNIEKSDSPQKLAEKIHTVEHNLYWRTLNDIFKG